MSAEVEELTVEYTDEETGEVVIKELDRSEEHTSELQSR